MLEFICFDSHAAGKTYAFYCWYTGKTYRKSILSWNFESHLSGHPESAKLLSFILGIFALYWKLLFNFHIRNTFKTFFNSPFAFEAWLCWATLWILTGETPMLLRVELSFFFGDSYSKKSSDDDLSNLWLMTTQSSFTQDM